MPRGIYKHQKGKSNFEGHHHSEETKTKLSKIRKGIKFSERWRRNMGEARKKEWQEGKRNRIFSAELKKKLSESHKGQHNSFKTEFKRGNTPPYKGKKMPERIREKMRKGYKYHLNSGTWKKGQNSGKNHPNWQGGKSFEPYSVDWTETLRRSIRERDNYICQVCNQYGKEVHHINYDKKNCNPFNLITLCHKCHCKTNKNRKSWIKYLEEIK